MSFPDRYSWLLPSLIFTAILMVIRFFIAGNIEFAFLAWNLFLAGLPLYFAHRSRHSGEPVRWLLAWLLFFPNSLYVATDLFHLRERPDVPLWFDLLFLLSAAFNGALWGFLSLRDAEAWLRRRIARRWQQTAVFGALLLCGFGIYLGRYLRYNSWDILMHPGNLAYDIGAHFADPYHHADAWALSLLFGIWGYLLYRMSARRSAFSIRTKDY